MSGNKRTGRLGNTGGLPPPVDVGYVSCSNLDFIKFPHARRCGSAVAVCVCRLLSCLLFSTPIQFFRATHQLTCYMQPNCHLGPLCECPRVGEKRIYQSNHMILFSYIFENTLPFLWPFFSLPNRFGNERMG